MNRRSAVMGQHVNCSEGRKTGEEFVPFILSSMRCLRCSILWAALAALMIGCSRTSAQQAVGSHPAGTPIQAPTPTKIDPINNPKADKLELMRHSFESPLNFANTLEEWDMAMASVPAKSMVVLTPAVANRTGQFWNKSPLKTSNWEIEFTFVTMGDNDSTISDGFAFWYVPEPYADTFPKTETEQREWDLLGYKSFFKGVGVFFTNFDRTGHYNPSISFAKSDGSREYRLLTDIPTTDGIYFPTRNHPTPVTFKMNVSPKGLYGAVRASPNDVWTDVFKSSSEGVEAGGYIGFTAFTGGRTLSPTDLKAKTSDKMGIVKLNVYNLDLNQPGEDSSIGKAALGPDGVETGDILRDHSHFKDQREQSEAIKQLTRLLYKHISEAGPRETTILKTLNMLQSSIQKLQTEIHSLHSDLHTHSAHTHNSSHHGHAPNDGHEHIVSELAGLRNLFHRHQQTHQDALADIHDTIRDVGSGSDTPVKEGVEKMREFAAKAAKLEGQLSMHTSLSSFLMIGVIIVISIAALLVWTRLREIEKSHLP